MLARSLHYHRGKCARSERGAARCDRDGDGREEDAARETRRESGRCRSFVRVWFRVAAQVLSWCRPARGSRWRGESGRDSDTDLLAGGRFGAWRKRHRRCRHNLCSLGRLSDVRVHRRVSVPCRDARLALQGYDDAQECAPNRCPLFLSSPFDKAREISLFPTWACNDFVEDGIRVVGNAASTSPLFARRFPFFPLAWWKKPPLAQKTTSYTLFGPDQRPLVDTASGFNYRPGESLLHCCDKWRNRAINCFE